MSFDSLEFTPGCKLIEDEVGPTPSLEDLDFLRTSGIVEDLVLQAESTRIRPGQVEGEAARPAAEKLGCFTCKMINVCPLANVLAERAAKGALRRNLVTAIQATNVPPWLTEARQAVTGNSPHIIDPTLLTSEIYQLPHELYEQARVFLGARRAESSLETTEANEAEWTTLNSAFFGNIFLVDSSAKPFIRKKEELPEITHIAAISPDDKLEELIYATSDGRRIAVIDASDALKVPVDTRESTEYRNLLGKLLLRTTSAASNGEPQIYTADNKMQKVIARVDGGFIFEIRMAGKNRLYGTISVPPKDTEQLPRIIILGGHGGDSTTQRRFINLITP